MVPIALMKEGASWGIFWWREISSWGGSANQFLPQER